MPDAELAALLLTNRLCDVGIKPFAAGEFWNLVARVGDLSVLLGSSSTEVAELTRLDPTESERVVGLLAAASAFAFERERLAEEGIQVVSALDERFPRRLVERLGVTCPSFLTVAGPIEWLQRGGLGVVGSRDASPEALEIARKAARAAVASSVPVISGLARGVDHESMAAAFDAGGAVIGFPADGLRKASRGPDVRRHVHAGELCIASPYAPGTSFTAGTAMGRNKLVYGLADVTLVVCCEHGKGGTWEGAKEALRRGFGPVNVWSGAGAGPGNAGLVALGAHAFADVESVLVVPEPTAATPEQTSLFSSPPA
jgi:predicted Rossmann fold nucleotide-binding protein DprA/Smf involved in DNA uptake